ncbi:Protein kinase domain,Protein kinase-like domain,Protein kinase, ATP binding site [Cinara cedri]|uniref:non-specific serine/threonine protein kinase n=1 Tax=Cinara cedri TaxID=506608 RepID=A0A5E4NI92_9HEMI|nr:Protein kinase domain,Protein kinase-like domain,Protein kinase, ATP binding site [Cinara cedri]
MPYSSDTSQFGTLKTYGKSRYTQVYGQNDDFDKFFGIEDVLKTTFISPEQTDSTKRFKNVKNPGNKVNTYSEWWPSKNCSTVKKKNYGISFNKKIKKSNYSNIAGNSKGSPISIKKSKKPYNFPKKVVCSTPLQRASPFIYTNKFNIASISSKKKKIKYGRKKNLGNIFNSSYYSLEVISSSDDTYSSDPNLSPMTNNKHRLIDKSVQLSGSHHLQPPNKEFILNNKYITNATSGYDELETEKYYKPNLNKPDKSKSSKKKKRSTSKEKTFKWCINTMDILHKKIPSTFEELSNTSYSIEEITNLEKSLMNQNCESLTVFHETKNYIKQNNPPAFPDLISRESLQSIKTTSVSSPGEDYFSATDEAIKCPQTYIANESKLSNNSLYVSCHQLVENHGSLKSASIIDFNVSEDDQISIDKSKNVNHKLSELACDNYTCTIENVESFALNKSCFNQDNTNKSSENAFNIESTNDIVLSMINKSNGSVVFNENSFESVENINLSSDKIVPSASDLFVLSNITNMLSDITIDQSANMYKQNPMDSKENTILMATSSKHFFKNNSLKHNNIHAKSNISYNNKNILNQSLHTPFELCEYLDNTVVCHSDFSKLNVNMKNESINSNNSFIVTNNASFDFDNISTINYKEDTMYGDHTNVSYDVSDELQSITCNVSKNRKKRYASRFNICVNDIIENPTDDNQIKEQNPPLLLEPGKKWRRSMIGILKKQSIDSNFHQSILDRSNIFKNSICRSSHSLNNSSGSENEIAKNYIFSMCNQQKPVSFESWLRPKLKRKWKKVGEGLYSEAFNYAMARTNTVVKIIPVEGDININNERQKMLFEISSELLIATALTELSSRNNWNKTHSFCKLKNLSCVQGKYPELLINLWTQYADDKGTDNDNPSILPEDQIFIILEMEDGGTNMEDFIFESATQALFGFIQLVFGLAVAEHHLNFEHRDLHTGNILVKKIATRKQIVYTLDGEIYSVQSYGIKITIIDFTLSRMTYNNKCIYNDLSVDFELFNGVIDDTSDYQFHIYPMMREENNNKWELFKPKTNIYWLHYVLDKMLTSVHYKNTKQSIHKTGLDNLQKLKDAILSFESVKLFSESDIILNFLK